MCIHCVCINVYTCKKIWFIGVFIPSLYIDYVSSVEKSIISDPLIQVRMLTKSLYW